MSTGRPPPPPPSGPSSSTLEDVAGGQRMLIVAIAVNLGAAVLRTAMGDNWSVVAPVALVGAALAVAGLLRLAYGLGYPEWKKALLVVLAFVPLLNLVMLAMVSERATKALRAGGHEVGLFGARRGGRTV